MHLYKDDHIKDVQSTCRGSCNTRMECWWLSTSSTSGSFWYSTSLSALCTQWGKTRYFCPPLPSCCVPLVPTDTSQKQKPLLMDKERGQNNVKLATANIQCVVFAVFQSFFEIRSESGSYCFRTSLHHHGKHHTLGRLACWWIRSFSLVLRANTSLYSTEP